MFLGDGDYFLLSRTSLGLLLLGLGWHGLGGCGGGGGDAWGLPADGPLTGGAGRGLARRGDWLVSQRCGQLGLLAGHRSDWLRFI